MTGRQNIGTGIAALALAAVAVTSPSLAASPGRAVELRSGTIEPARETIERIDEIDRDIPNPMTEDGLRRL